MNKSEPERDNEERLERIRAHWQALNRRRAHRRRLLVAVGTAALGVVVTVPTVTFVGRSLSEPPDRAMEGTGALEEPVVAPSSESSPKGLAINPHEAGKGSIREVELAARERVALEERPRGGSSRVLTQPPRVPRSHRPLAAQTGEMATAKPAAAVASPPPSRLDPESAAGEPAASVPSPAPSRVDRESAALTGESAVATSSPVSSQSPSVTPDALKRVLDYISEMHIGSTPSK